MDLRRINFGIEIETVKRTRERVAQAIQSVMGGQVRHIGSPGSFLPSTIPRLGRRSTEPCFWHGSMWWGIARPELQRANRRNLAPIFPLRFKST
jgi:hypothetical protein